MKRIRDAGYKAAHIHLRHLSPLPKDLGDLLRGFKRVVIPENNAGQLLQLIRGTYAIDAKGINMVRGLPFKAADIESAVREHIALAGEATKMTTTALTRKDFVSDQKSAGAELR